MVWQVRTLHAPGLEGHPATAGPTTRGRVTVQWKNTKKCITIINRQEDYKLGKTKDLHILTLKFFEKPQCLGPFTRKVLYSWEN